MQNSYGRAVLLISLFFIFEACAAGISQESRSQITYDGPFADIQRNPAKYRGQILMIGGKVIETAPKEGITEMVVLQLETGSQDRPMESDHSQGRFIARSAQFVDPAIFPPGALITVVGRVQSSETRRIGEMPYTYPIIEIMEIKKWPPSLDPSPRFHFGVGIGTHF